MKVKVYYHIWEAGRGYEETLIFQSNEFGLMEYFDSGDPLIFKSKTDLICGTFNANDKESKIAMFKKYSKFVYLGEL